MLTYIHGSKTTMYIHTGVYIKYNIRKVLIHITYFGKVGQFIFSPDLRTDILYNTFYTQGIIKKRETQKVNIEFKHNHFAFSSNLHE